MLNAKLIKEQLNTNDIISIVESLGGELRHVDISKLIFTSVCHNIDANDISHKPKLYYDIDKQLFHCFVCDFGGDIFSLIQTRWGLLDKEDDFIDVLNYVIDVCDLDIDKASVKPKEEKFDWGFLDKIVRLKNGEQGMVEPAVYDSAILKFFTPIYPLEWLEEGISINSMAKYKIGYYAFKNAIMIPIYDGDNLVGVRGRFKNPGDLEYGKYRPISLLDGTTYKFPISYYFYGWNENKKAIKRAKKCLLVESEKAVLKSDTWFGDNSITLGMFGKNLSKYKLKKILTLGIKECIIGIDSDFKEYGDSEYDEFEKNAFKIAHMLKGYCKVSVIYNNQGYEGYQYSPFDFTREQYDIMWNNREEIKC